MASNPSNREGKPSTTLLLSLFTSAWIPITGRRSSHDDIIVRWQMRITQIFLLIDKYQLTPAHEDIRIRIARAIDKLIVDCRDLLRVWPILLSWHWGGKVGREPLEFERVRPVLTVP